MRSVDQTAPVRIDEIPLPDGRPGRLFATGFSVVGPDPDAALDHVGADLLLCLITDHEIGLRFPAFGDWLRDRAGGRALHAPVEDGGVGDDDAVEALITDLGRRLDAGASIVTHCGAGLGRTSVVCGLLLVRAGVPLTEALATVRTARPGSGPENPDQRAHLDRMAARLLR